MTSNFTFTMKLICCISVFVLINCLHSAFANEVSYLKYCLNGSDPDIFPNHGAHSSGSIVMTPKPESSSWYRPDMNCSITLATEPNYYFLLTFSNVSLRNSSMDNLTIFYDNGNSNAVLAGQQVCSNENCEGLKFESGNFNNITLKFISANVTVPQNVTGFQAHYTVYDLANPKTGACRDKHKFLCENKHCIFYEFVCDGHNNCGDLSDETKCEIPVKDTVWGIVAIVGAILAILIFVPCMCFLAISGTQNIVKLVTLPNDPTPLLNTAACGETSSLLTSSEAANICWPGTSYDSCNYGTVQHGEYSGNNEPKKSHSHSQIEESQENKFL
ncbi:hypothetical protein AVEN_136527-1 [Araneus ventricosus]|uniref:CUB domain-containing protein n=1 Tax=Araneus ventricosus TaxID=182803 RepID=A0A4Y2QH87_ARAVE|nr:hypothetical protein AVEN_136527-1 [Araneus ventricosus]